MNFFRANINIAKNTNTSSTSEPTLTPATTNDATTSKNITPPQIFIQGVINYKVMLREISEIILN